MQSRWPSISSSSISTLLTLHPHPILGLQQRLQHNRQLLHLSVPLSLCYWILQFLVDRPQSVKLNNLQSSTIVLNTGAPQGCVLSLLLYSLFANACISHHSSVQLIKFADDTTAEGIIENSDESSYRQEVDRLLSLC